MFYVTFYWATMKDGHPERVNDDWAFTGGTGTLKGIKGKGTYNATENESGWRVNMQGEYAIATHTSTKATEIISTS